MSSALRISLVANLALTGLVLVLLWRDRPSSAAPVAAITGAAPISSGEPDTATSDPATVSEPPSLAAANKLTPAVVDQLESMGISREVIVNAVLGEFHRRWDGRFADLERRYAPRQVPEREYVELARVREADQVRELKETLGEERYREWDKEQTLRVLNTGGIRLTEAEAEQAYRMQKEFIEQAKARQMAMEDGVADVVDLAALDAQARETLDAQFQELLGKERFDAMRGVADPIADMYRKFGDLNPTPDQARTALRVEEDYRAGEAALAARLRTNPTDAANVAAEFDAIQEARERALAQAFGAEAYETMRRQNDATYRQLTQFADAWELGDHEIEPVYEMLRTFHDRAGRTRAVAALRESAGQRVNWNEVDASIEQARRQTEADLQMLIGDKRLWRLKQNGVLTSR